MKRRFATTIVLIINSFICMAQTHTDFTGKIVNKEFNIYIEMNFHDKNIVIPNQEFMGEMAGYLGDYEDFRKWLIIEADIKKNTAKLQIINLEGSEDLEATLTHSSDGTYKLKQGEGSTIKIARNRKWKKLPKEIIFQPVESEKK